MIEPKGCQSLAIFLWETRKQGNTQLVSRLTVSWIVLLDCRFYWSHLSRERPQSSGTPLGATTTLKYWSAHTPQTWAESGKDGFSRQTTWGHIWKRKLEKSRTNMTNVTLHHLWNPIGSDNCSAHPHQTWAEFEKNLREDTDCQNHHLKKPIFCKTSQYVSVVQISLAPKHKNFSTHYWNLK